MSDDKPKYAWQTIERRSMTVGNDRLSVELVSATAEDKSVRYYLSMSRDFMGIKRVFPKGRVLIPYEPESAAVLSSVGVALGDLVKVAQQKKLAPKRA